MKRLFRSIFATFLLIPLFFCFYYIYRQREQGTIESFRNIYQKGGVAGFWRGWQPKVVESFLKGGILLFAKESIIRASLGVGMTEVYAGLLGGFGGGVAQVRIRHLHELL